MGSNKNRRASIKNPSGKKIKAQEKTIANAIVAAIRAELPHLNQHLLSHLSIEKEREEKILLLDREKTIQLSLIDAEEDSESESSIMISESESDESTEKLFSNIEKNNNFYICLLDNLVSKGSSMHTEHAFCEEKIKKNISFILDYLNNKNNKKVTNTFFSH
ncbi:MAG: hypothetical protein ACX932_04065 [Gammaproteobacteria bacterium]